MPTLRFTVVAFAAVLTLLTSTARAQDARAVAVDEAGVIRWKDNGSEVRLFGANYCLPSASDYRAAGRVGDDLHAMIDQDMAHFARMGFDGLRLSFWGDSENSDADGNLIENEHLALLDYLIAQASERGIYMLLSPIVNHSAQWPDAMDEQAGGFFEHFRRSDLGTDPRAIAAQARYLQQLLEHVNPHTGRKLADEPNILFVELINEPTHHSHDVDGSVRYINALVDAVRAAGCEKLVVHNLSQDFGMADAIRASEAAGVTIGWYPTGLMSGHTLAGNHLPTVDAYTPLLDGKAAGLPRLVYEFDHADSMDATMYPAMARTFRTVGVQFAAMFSYDMLATAPCNLGWQTHYLNLTYTPRKAVSVIIAGEALRRLPAGQDFGRFPRNTSFGDFHLDSRRDLAELRAADALMHAGDTTTPPPDVAAMRRIVGIGSSPVVGYSGHGAYFLDKLADGVWRLEVNPDAFLIADLFEKPALDRPVARIIERPHTMTVRLPDLGPTYTVTDLIGGANTVADGGAFVVEPGVYVLGKAAVDPATLPQRVGSIGLAEFVSPEPAALPRTVQLTLLDELVVGRAHQLTARILDTAPPADVTMQVWQGRDGERRTLPTTTRDGYHFTAELPADLLVPGSVHVALSIEPERSWESRAVLADAPLTLLHAEPEPVRVVRDQAMSHVVVNAMAQRSAEDFDHAVGLRIRSRSAVDGGVFRVTLVEHDGTSWAAPIETSAAWREIALPWSAFQLTRGRILPRAYPGRWNEYLPTAEGRGGESDALRVADIERVQIVLEERDVAAVEVAEVTLQFGQP